MIIFIYGNEIYIYIYIYLRNIIFGYMERLMMLFLFLNQDNINDET